MLYYISESHCVFSQWLSNQFRKTSIFSQGYRKNGPVQALGGFLHLWLHKHNLCRKIITCIGVLKYLIATILRCTKVYGSQYVQIQNHYVLPFPINSFIKSVKFSQETFLPHFFKKNILNFFYIFYTILQYFAITDVAVLFSVCQVLSIQELQLVSSVTIPLPHWLLYVGGLGVKHSAWQSWA